MFGRRSGQHKRTGSSSTAHTNNNDNVPLPITPTTNTPTRIEAPLVSPLQMTFDFELPTSPISLTVNHDNSNSSSTEPDYFSRPSVPSPARSPQPLYFSHSPAPRSPQPHYFSHSPAPPSSQPRSAASSTPTSPAATRPQTRDGPLFPSTNAWANSSARSLMLGPPDPLPPYVVKKMNSAVSLAQRDKEQYGNPEAGRESRARGREDNDDMSIMSGTSKMSTTSKKSTVLKGTPKSQRSFEPGIDPLPTPPLQSPRPTTPASFSAAPKTVDANRLKAAGPGEGGSGASSSNSTPRMEASLFPVGGNKPHTPPLSPTMVMAPAMSRQFIDSRDKPYSAPPRPMLQQNHSSPNLLQPTSSNISSKLRDPGDLPQPRLTPQASAHNLSSRATTYSGSTARPSTRGSSRTAVSSASVSTIGTPYQATVDSFPLPQHVKTRPKTPGAATKVAGVSVPTHHTSAFKTEPPKKKKRGLLGLLQRQRSSQDPDVLEEERATRLAQAQALARQRAVLASGVNNPPPDFDPRIKGRGVHDFNAPREKRNTFDEMDMQNLQYGMPTASHSSVSASKATAYPPRQTSLVNRGQIIEQSPRRSTHTPIFTEVFTDDLDSSNRTSFINAENLENKDFVQRASKHSSMTSHSQESAVLPPFARRSQMLDPVQASLYQDDDSSRSSEPSSEIDRGSTRNSNNEVSPITGRNSVGNAEMRFGASPVSPSGPRRQISSTNKTAGDDAAFRPESEISKSSSDDSHKRASEMTARPYSAVVSPPLIKTINETSPDRPSGEPSVKRDTVHGPPRVLLDGVSIRRPNTPSSATVSSPIPALDSPLPSRDMPEATDTLEHTPVLDNDASISPQIPSPKLVEKRKSAVGHTRKTSLTPKHHASNASRFSFQYGESAAEEQALEEKHRKITSREIAHSVVRGRSPGEDDEDYFDESAMDDMDELEMQHTPSLPVPGDGSIQNAGTSQSSLYLRKAREVLHQQPDSDDGSIYDDEIPDITDEHEITYADHPAFRAHSALGNYSGPKSSRGNSGISAEGYWRDSTFDHYMRDPSLGSGHSRMQSNVSKWGVEGESSISQNLVHDEKYRAAADSDPGAERSRSNFYLQPQAAGHSIVQDRPPIPLRDSGDSERNRVASGMSFGASTGSPASSGRGLSRTEFGERGHNFSTESPESTRLTVRARDADPPPVRDRLESVDDTNAPSSLRNREANNTRRSVCNGLGLSDFAGFDFGETVLSNQFRTSAPDDVNLNKTVPKVHSLDQTDGETGAKQGSDKPASPGADSVRRTLPFSTQSGRPYEDSHDDMYFDDGNFDQETGQSDIASFDENAFDDDSFLYRPNAAVNNRGHSRDLSNMTFASASSDGPYPTFAIPNSGKAQARYSQLLLEDLPLQTTVDPRYIPQRNPSEDMKRLGLSDKVPPVPVAESNTEAYQQMQDTLTKYHAALAEAANKAASDGRFLRAPSSATQRSVSNSSIADDAKSQCSTHDERSIADDRSFYSHDEDGGEIAMPNNKDKGIGSGNGLLGVAYGEANASRISHLTNYSAADPGSPPKMSFDFGFNQGGIDDSNEDYEDEDLIAAANTDVLASDDEGFYGQEFQFFGKPRANSGELQAINGGYFGEDGDDGLQRNKSLREPNLTPITERSEFSTRNSFIGMGQFAPIVVGGYTPHSPALSRMPITPLVEDDITSLDDLRKLRARAFGDGGSNRSLKSINSNRSSQNSHLSPTLDTAAGAAAAGHTYFIGGSPMQYGYSNGGSSGSSNPPTGHPSHNSHLESPHSAASSNGNPFAMDIDATPKRQSRAESPQTAKKALPMGHPTSPIGQGHSRKGSGADSVTYVREADPIGGGKPRWVMEKRRTSEQGQLELIGRELVEGGWI